MAKTFSQLMAARYKSITTNGDKLNKYIHETAMMIFDHAKEHHDPAEAQRLVMALPASMRREMLILWFSKFTPIKVKNDEKWVAQAIKPTQVKLYVEWDREGAMDKPFYELAEENKEKEPLDFEGLLKLVERLKGTIEKKVEKGEVPEYLTETAKNIARQLSAIKVDRVEAPVANDDEKKEEPKEQAA